MQNLTKSIQSTILKTVQVEPGEGRALFWSFSYFFSLLCSYYILRPMRDEMGIIGGVENLQWLFTGTLLIMLAAVPLFGWISSRFPRKQFLPYVYLFFISALVIFYILMGQPIAQEYIARAFFIWVSVFNLFVVSVFWSFMTDLFNSKQATRLFGFITAGGTIGALAGPAITALLVQSIGGKHLLLISAFFLGWAIICIYKLSSWENEQKIQSPTTKENTQDSVIGGGVWDGVKTVFKSPYLLGICFLMLLFTTLATFLYFMQAQIIRDAFADSAERTAVFATMDLLVNSLTLILQIFLTSRLIKWFGIATVLAIVPVLLAIGFALLSISPMLIVILGVQVIRRAGNYAVMRPVREMLYVVLERDEKYKAKNFIDTFIYRAGDAVSAWLYTLMRSLGLSLSGIALVAVPMALIWAVVAFKLGRHQNKLAKK